MIFNTNCFLVIIVITFLSFDKSILSDLLVLVKTFLKSLERENRLKLVDFILFLSLICPRAGAQPQVSIGFRFLSY